MNRESLNDILERESMLITNALECLMGTGTVVTDIDNVTGILSYCDKCDYTVDISYIGSYSVKISVITKKMDS